MTKDYSLVPWYAAAALLAESAPELEPPYRALLVTGHLEKLLAKMELELTHRKRGHRSMRFLMAASLHGAWDDYKLT